MSNLYYLPTPDVTVNTQKWRVKKHNRDINWSILLKVNFPDKLVVA